MKNYDKYQVGYFPPPTPHNEWVKKDHLEKVLNDGYRTYDIAKEGEKAIGTVEAGDLIVEAIN